MAKLYPISTAHNHDEIYAKIGEGGVTDHGALTGLGDNDHPQYLLTTAQAADSDKVDGKHAADFLGVNAKAADSDKLDGLEATAFAPVGHNHSGTYLPWDGKAADSNLLDGNDSTYFAPASSIVTDHGALTGLADDDHSQYLNNTRHDTTTRHALGTVVPHDDHGMLSGLGDDDHPQYLKSADFEDCQVSAYRDSTTFSLSTSGSLYAVPLNQESYDTHGSHDNTTNPERFVCKKAGTYLVMGIVTFAANSTGNRDALVRVNGSNYVGNNRSPAMSSGVTSVPVSTLVTLSVNDYVELIGRQYSGGSLDLYYANSISNFMNMTMITKTNADGWSDWIPTVTGWAAGYVVNVARYKLIGKTCFFTLDISGTSNSTAVTATMPFTSYSGAGDPVWGGTNAYVQNNGTVATTSASRWYIGENSATLIAHTNMSTGTWTASGTKRIRVTGFYEIA